MRRVLAAIGLALFAVAPAAAAPAQRVVSVFLCTDEYVYRLLPATRIAALSFLSADRHPVVSTIADQVKNIPLIPMSAEAALAAKPDLAVISEGTSSRVRDVLRLAGVSVIDVPFANSLDDIRKITRDLAAKLGVPETGEKLIAQMDTRLAAARAAAPQPPAKTLLYEPNGYTVSGGVTDAIMAVGGLANAAPQMRATRQGTIAVETVVADSPELLILNGKQGDTDSRARQLLRHPALAKLDSRTHVEWMKLTALLCPGPWSAKAAEDFANAARVARGLAPIKFPE